MQQDGILSALCDALSIPVFGVCDFSPSLLGVPCRSRTLPNGAKSVIVCLFPYYVGRFSYRNISRYAMLPDYHEVAAGALNGLANALYERFPGEEFLPLSDISPLREVAAGVLAGLGVRGINGQLINKTYGSYVFIGEVVSTWRFPPSSPEKGGCLACGACIAACPAGALSKEGSHIYSSEFLKQCEKSTKTPFNAGLSGKCDGFFQERCLSFLTQRKKLLPHQAEAVAAGKMVWGCDRCTDVCPMNRSAAYTPLAQFYRDIVPVITEQNLGGVFPGRAFSYKGEGVIKRNLELIGKNRD